MNLRGAVVPVMDLARRLEVEGGGDPEHNVLIVEVPDPEGPWSLGLLVREVLDVREADLSRAQPAPELGRRGARFTSGLLREEDGGALRLLDLRALADSLRREAERQSCTARGM
jgi:purine-binding chemotaxis protein CheW